MKLLVVDPTRAVSSQKNQRDPSPDIREAAQHVRSMMSEGGPGSQGLVIPYVDVE